LCVPPSVAIVNDQMTIWNANPKSVQARSKPQRAQLNAGTTSLLYCRNIHACRKEVTRDPSALSFS